jgi:hypothetical protein
VPISCRYKHAFGPSFCGEACPAAAACGIFKYQRVERLEDLPPADDRVIDVAILDMNHGWPNLGHDSLVHTVQDAACDLQDPLAGTGLQVRALSFDVRRNQQVPELPGGRFALYLGTGGPAHLDPYQNDGVSEFSQGVKEDPSWQGPTFKLFDAILADREAALISVCHTFGVMCRWAGVAEPSLRGAEKGGKSSGLLENVLTTQALAHPWFSRFARSLGSRMRLRIADNRLFDLVPPGRFPVGITPIGQETLGIDGPPGDAVTMVEFARDAAGVMPRVFGVNHHPEIVDRGRQLLILQQKRDRGEVSEQWYAERLDIMTRMYPDENSDQRLHLTSDYTLLGPLRYHLLRQVRRRTEALRFDVGVHEDRILELVADPPPLHIPAYQGAL